MINEATREIFLYQEFGPSWAGMIDAPLAQTWLSTLGSGDLVLRVNSYGGAVDEALAIVAMLQRHEGSVTVTVDSIAASAATLFCAAFPTTIAAHARMMIHNPLMKTEGNKRDHEKAINILDTYKDGMMALYVKAMKDYSKEEIESMLDEETWMMAQAAIDVGLASQMYEPTEKIQARATTLKFKNPLPFEVEKISETWQNDIAAEQSRLRLKFVC